MSQELEVKLSAGPTFSEQQLIERLAAQGALSGDETRQQVDTYLDTEDAELARAGLSARTRRKDGALSVEVKPVPIRSELVMDRAELAAEVDNGESAGKVLRRLLRRELGLKISGTPMPKAELRTDRRQIDYRNGALSAEVCIDRVRVHRPGGEEVDSFTEVEIELQSGDSQALMPLASIGLDLGLEPSGRSKYLRAREALQLPPYAYGDPRPTFEPSTPQDEFARAVCRHQFETMLAYEPGTRVGLDTEHLHKMRVASRRLRTALRVFGKLLPEDDVKWIGKEVRWLGRKLGAVRDLDVHSLALPDWRRHFDDEPNEGWNALEMWMHKHRARARRSLIEALDSSRYQKLVQRATTAFAEGPGQGEPVGKAASLVLGQCVEKFHQGVDRFSQTHAAEDAHRLRILGKRLRYTAEFLKPILDESISERISRLSEFQDALGEVQDAVAAGAFARHLYERSKGDRDLTFVLGVLVGWAAATEAQARPHVDAALEALDADTLLRELEAAAAHLGDG
jgi:CHAD domain-containing protein